ncbi:uncharacterized protein LOC100680042 isoform X2 [Nasonia vitripennis]|uniref:Uncharacterized protein n=1 Tax=Nasonia vitripennis TaxID=7425 RepID=A0A7M7T6V7_NASVI|nr:uncharacterized protein LOC100680042 isoform X2 [Nasonia vitripennis]
MASIGSGGVVGTAAELTSPTSSTCSSVDLVEVPQWKRELIQRRKQRELLGAAASNGAATSTSASLVRSSTATTTTTSSRTSGSGAAPDSPPSNNAPAAIPSSADDAAAPLAAAAASDMRLEAPDAAPLSTDEDELIGGRPPASGKCRAASKEVLDIVELANKMRATNNAKLDIVAPSRTKQQEDCESDSSEELQYGPGIVHKLRSKYLNMTLREMNKNRASVQCFRRAASLEDLLDHKDEAAEKTRRYAKKNVTGAAAKVERYRNAARGNESMKRARSVETLMRYNSAPEEAVTQNHSSRLAPNIFKQENDHIILVDRTTVKIENRLDKDRLKPINKPKRVKPVLADTERPPPDLVKNNMRIFESSSVKKLKPKGEVAVKVATFKTINDTFKAQNQKKIIPKPPLQPKPFVNGNSKMSTSPRKIIIQRKPTAELIEQQNSQDSYHNDGVITEPIVQSVSSVVSKFQQIEKSYSPSSSPEPSYNKFKFSPVPSPEPSAVRAKVSSLDIKSPTTTPIPSPRTSPPKIQSPLSPKPDIPKSPSSFMQKPIVNSTPISNNTNDQPKLPVPELPKLDFEKEKDEPSVEQVQETTVEMNNQNAEEAANEVSKLSDSTPSSPGSTVLVESFDESVESVVDSPRTVSKSALDNISKAGMTVQFSFNDHPAIKNYLPRSASTPQPAEENSPESEVASSKLVEEKCKSPCSLELESVALVSEIISTAAESPTKPQERLQEEIMDEIIYKEENVNIVENKPIGAISSLSLIKSTTTTSFSQGNESKTIRTQKSETSNSPPQKQIGIIRPLVSTKTQLPQQNLSNREIEKNLINRVKSIEQPTKVVVSLKSAEEIQPVKKNNSSGGLWDSKPWNQQNNTMVFNFSNRKDVPDYIENDGLIIKRKRDKPRSSDNSGVIVSNIDSVQLTDDSDTEYSVGPPSPCDVAFYNDNVLINGRSNLSRTPRNHKHRIQFDDTATRTFEYPSEASMLLEAEATSSLDGETSASGDAAAGAAAARSAGPSGTLPSLLGGSGLASYTPSKVDLASEGFELGVTRATMSTLASPQSATPPQQLQQQHEEDKVDYLKPSQDPGTWGQETAADMLY